MATLDLLMYLSDRDKTEGFVEKFKLQLVGSDPAFWAAKLYPEFFQGSDDDESEYDFKEGVEYIMPEMTEEQMQALMNEMLNSDPSAMTFDEYKEQDDW